VFFKPRRGLNQHLRCWILFNS